MLKMMSIALTNAEKHVTSYIACKHSQWDSNDSVFWLAQNDIVRYDVISRLLSDQTEHHFKCSDRPVVDNYVNCSVIERL